jgi:hypothetical protein
MNIPKQQEQSAEERIGSMIGKIIVIALIAFFCLGLCVYVCCKVGDILTYSSQLFALHQLRQLGDVHWNPPRCYEHRIELRQAKLQLWPPLWRKQ